MKKLVLAATVALGLATPSMAADMRMPVKAPPPTAIAAVFNWTGFYIGGQGGWAWGTSVQSFDTGALSDATDRYRISGVNGGGTVGYNFQLGSIFVAGVEADFSLANIKGTGQSGVFFNCDTPSTCHSNVDWFGTVRGRGGFAVQNAFIYGTGGWAFARIETSLGSGPPLTGTSTRSGWTAGGGVEYAFTQNWSAKIEYLHLRFGSYQWTNGASGTANCIGINCSTDARLNVIRAGLNYRFGGPVVARY